MSIFEDGDKPTETPEGEQAPDQETPEGQGAVPPKHEDSAFSNMLQGITNDEGKPKYSSVQQALDSIPHAQKHIKQLEQDNQSLKDEITSLKEQVQDYKQKVDRQLSVEELLEDRQKQDLSPEDIESLVTRTLTAREQAALARQNTTSVANSLVEMYGDKEAAEKEFLALQEELGVDLVELSAKSPKAVLRYFKKEGTKVPDKFNNQARTTFEPDQTPPKARMPRTTKEGISAWRASGDNIRKKYGIE